MNPQGDDNNLLDCGMSCLCKSKLSLEHCVFIVGGCILALKPPCALAILAQVFPKCYPIIQPATIKWLPPTLLNIDRNSRGRCEGREIISFKTLPVRENILDCLSLLVEFLWGSPAV